MTVHQDVRLFAVILGPGESVPVELDPSRRAWVHVASGSVALGKTELGEGDGAAVEREGPLSLVGRAAAEVLIFDLA